MSKVIFDISMSLDGFMTADGITAAEPMGQSGQRLHAWADADSLDRAPSPLPTIGALITGRRTYETSLPWWGDEGPHHPIPVFVITRDRAHQASPHGVYSFVTTGIEAALDQARAAARQKDVRIMGGASLGQQYLAAGLVDEIVVHLVPTLLKAGTPMFIDLGPGHVGLEVIEVQSTPLATHLHYRVSR